MNRCPLTYEPLVEGAYSLRGLRRLSPRLSELRPLPYSAADQLREAALRADKISIQGVQPKLSARLVPARGAFEKDWLDYWARDRLALTDRSIQGVLDAFAAAVPAWHELLGRSFLPPGLREGYRAILGERLQRLGLE